MDTTCSRYQINFIKSSVAVGFELAIYESQILPSVLGGHPSIPSTLLNFSHHMSSTLTTTPRRSQGQLYHYDVKQCKQTYWDIMLEY